MLRESPSRRAAAQPAPTRARTTGPPSPETAGGGLMLRESRSRWAAPQPAPTRAGTTGPPSPETAGEGWSGAGLRRRLTTCTCE